MTTTVVDPRFTPELLAELDRLWLLDMHIGVVRSRLFKMSGHLFTAGTVRDAATRWRPKPPKPEPSPPAAPIPVPYQDLQDPPGAVAIPFVYRSALDIVNKVPPGTYPANRFSMINGRIK